MTAACESSQQKKLIWNNETIDISAPILNEAYKKPSLQENYAIQKLEEILKDSFDDIKIFHKIKTPSGTPKKEFLKRLIVRRPYIRKLKENAAVSDLLNGVYGNIMNDKETRSDKLWYAEKLRSIVTNTEMKADASKWITENTKKISEMISVYLRNSNSLMIEEGCITVSVLAHHHGKVLNEVTNTILQDLLYSLSEITEVYDKFFNKVYDLKKAFSNKKMINASSAEQFVKPRLILASSDSKQDQIAYIIYSITFLFHYCLDTDLVIVYVNYLLHMPGYCRIWLLHILDVINQIQLRNKIKKEYLWVSVAVELFFTLIRGLNDTNSYNKKVLNRILLSIKNSSIIRLPQIDEFQMRIEQCFEKYLTERNIQMSGLKEERSNSMEKYTSPSSISIIGGSVTNWIMSFDRLGRKRSSEIIPKLDVFLIGGAKEQMDATFREVQSLSKSGSILSDLHRKSTCSKQRQTYSYYRDTRGMSLAKGPKLSTVLSGGKK